MRATEDVKPRNGAAAALSTDLAILERRVRIARARYNAARSRADLAQRAHFWSDRPTSETRDGYYAALREEIEAKQALDDAEAALFSAEHVRPA